MPRLAPKKEGRPYLVVLEWLTVNQSYGFNQVFFCSMKNQMTKSILDILVNWEYNNHSLALLGTPRHSQELPGIPKAFRNPSQQELPGILRIFFLFVRVKPCQMSNTKSSAEAMCKDWEEKGGKSCSLHQSQLGFRAAHVVHLKFIGHLKFSLGWDIRL